MPADVDAGACRACNRVARYWRRHFSLPEKVAEPISVEHIAVLLAAAYPDRLGRLRDGSENRYRFSSGQGGQLSSRSSIAGAEFLVAVNMVGGRNGDGQIHLASSVSRETLEELFAERLVWRPNIYWDRERQRVTACEEKRLGSLVVAERPRSVEACESVPALLEGLRLLGLEVMGWSAEACTLKSRVQFVAETFPEQEWPDFSDAGLLADAERWLAPYVEGLRSRDDLARFDPLPALRACFDWSQQQRLDEMAPTHLAVPSGRRVRLDYVAEGPPVLAAKLQELFGLADTPRVAGGRVAVRIHLLSPAGRPLAVTQDLASFWNSVYPEVKKEMAGRYPKHPWPDDPWQAIATRAVKRKKQP